MLIIIEISYLKVRLLGHNPNKNVFIYLLALIEPTSLSIDIKKTQKIYIAPKRQQYI